MGVMARDHRGYRAHLSADYSTHRATHCVTHRTTHRAYHATHRAYHTTTVADATTATGHATGHAHAENNENAAMNGNGGGKWQQWIEGDRVIKTWHQDDSDDDYVNLAAAEVATAAEVMATAAEVMAAAAEVATANENEHKWENKWVIACPQMIDHVLDFLAFLTLADMRHGVEMLVGLDVVLHLLKRDRIRPLAVVITHSVERVRQGDVHQLRRMCNFKHVPVIHALDPEHMRRACGSRTDQMAVAILEEPPFMETGRVRHLVRLADKAYDAFAAMKKAQQADVPVMTIGRADVKEDDD